MENINNKNFLSEDLAHAISKYAKREDLKEIQNETGVSVSTLIGIRKREGVVTERSKEAVNKLVKRAYNNASSTEKEAKKCKNNLKAFLDCI